MSADTLPILISPEQLAELQQAEPVVMIDTRDPEAYAAGHIAGAVNLREIFTYLATSTPENFRDTVALSLGAEYRLNEQVTLRGGTMYDQTPVQDVYRTPRIADNDRIWLSVGATWRATEKLAISGAYSHLFAANSTVALSDAGPGSPNFLKGNLNATYNLGIDIVSAQVSYKF
jgi:long-chain fatty acid transport protein